METKFPNHVLTEDEIDLLIEKARTLNKGEEFSLLLRMMYVGGFKLKYVLNEFYFTEAEIHNKFRELLKLCDMSNRKRISIHSIRSSRIHHMAKEVGIDEIK